MEASSSPEPSRLPRTPIVLASASPRRQAILQGMGVPFVVDPPTKPEPDPALFPTVELFVGHAAHAKALETAERRRGQEWILAADTVAEVEGQVLGKPADRADAERILRLLVGRRHRTWTGMCLLRSPDRLALVQATATWVTFRRVSEEDLQAYLDGGIWEGKAGAYGVQDADDPFVEKVEGSFTNVVGLPMETAAFLLAAAARFDELAWNGGMSKNP